MFYTLITPESFNQHASCWASRLFCGYDHMSPSYLETLWVLHLQGGDLSMMPRSCVNNAVKWVLQNSWSVFLLPQMGGTPFGGLGAPNMEQMAAMGMPGPNMNPQVSPRLFVVAVPARSGTSSPSWLHPFYFFLSGSFCRFPEAHAVHGPKVRTYTLFIQSTTSRLWGKSK